MALSRALVVTQTTLGIVDFVLNDPTGLWVGYPNKWEVLLTITSISNSGATLDFAYDSNDIKVGDWVSTSARGVACKIVEIVEIVDTTSIKVILEDEEIYNILNDEMMSGNGIGPDGKGLVFPIDDMSGLPVLGPVQSYEVDINLQMDLFARFIQQQKLKGGGSDFLGTPTDTTFVDGALKGWIPGTTTLTDAIDQLNFYMERALPTKPTDVAALDIKMDLAETTPYGVMLASGTIPNNTSASFAPGDIITAIRSTAASSLMLTEVGLGNVGTLSFAVNGTANGEVILTKGSNVGTYGGILIDSDYDFPLGSTNAWEALDMKLSSTVPDGINEFKLSHSMTGTTTKHFVVETLTTAPVISDTTFSVNNEVLVYSSGVPHLTTGSVISYTMTANNIIGRTYPSERIMGMKTFPVINNSYIDHDTAGMPTVKNVDHGPISMTHTLALDAENVASISSLSYFASSSMNETETLVDDVLVYLHGEDTFLVETPTENNFYQIGIKRVSLDSGARPVVTTVDWNTNFDSGNSSSLGDLKLWEAPIIAGSARATQINYGVGFIPTGPDFTGKPATQYLSFKIQSITNRIKLDIDGEYTGVFIKLPGITNDMPNAINGWWDGMKQADHAPLNWPGHLNASDGCLLSKVDTIAEFTFGNISSSASTENIILVQFVLSGTDEIRKIRIV